MESLETQVQRCWEAFCALRGNLVFFLRFLFPGLGLTGVREGLAPEDLGEEDVPGVLERARWRPEYPELATSVEQP